MKVSCTSEEVMIIEITKDELESCHLTYEKLDKSALKSKTAICRIISETQKISGESIRISENTQVDILPDGEGGCLIILNSKGEERTFENLRIYQNESIDPILDLAKHIGNNENIKSGLFKKDKLFRLVLSAPKSVHLRCSEFLDIWGEGETDSQRTKEFFDCMIPDNALKILGGFASEK